MIRSGAFVRRTGAALLLVTGLSGSAAAQRGSLTATLAGHRKTPASDTLALRISVAMTPGWHIGATRPGSSGLPTELTWRLPPGWRLVATRWPAPTATVVGRDSVFEYRGPFTIETTIVMDGPRRSGPIQAVVSYGICREVCIPGRLTLTYDVR